MLDMHDVEALLSEVESFAIQRIAAATERPEATLTTDSLTQISTQAAELGLIPGNDADAGFALWAQCNHAGSMAFNLGLLEHAGYANAGIALAWHRASLAAHVAKALGVDVSGGEVLASSIVTTGHYGLAQSHLGRFLGEPASNTDTSDDTLLSDWLDRRHATTVLAPASWEKLLWPVWHAGQIRWQLTSREALDVASCRAQHGLNELSSFAVRQPAEWSSGVLPAGADDRKFYARALKLDMLGLLAIGTGAIRRAKTYATDYAALRKQGGKVIASHPAVQHMLGEIDMTQRQALSMLQRLAQPVDALALADIAALRASTHVVLCHAANQAVQVFGGIGYMRDAGPEKLLRDQNMLKLQTGGLREIPLLLAGLNGGRA